jgi:hypothetical protein
LQLADRLSLVPRSKQIEHPLADRRALENTAVEEDSGRHEEFLPRLPFHQCGKCLAGCHIRSAPGEKAGQMFADHGIGCIREAEFL